MRMVLARSIVLNRWLWLAVLGLFSLQQPEAPRNLTLTGNDLVILSNRLGTNGEIKVILDGNIPAGVWVLDTMEMDSRTYQLRFIYNGEPLTLQLSL